MTQLSIGDLAQSLQLRRQGGQLSAELTRLAEELTSARRQDIRAAVSGDTAGLAAIEQGLERVEAFDLSIKDVTLEVAARQQSIDTIRRATQANFATLVLDETFADPQISITAARDAAADFDRILATLNGVVNNRSLFAGTSTDSVAVADSDTILTAIETEIAAAGVTTPTDVEALVETWFAPGGGFDVVGYVGSPDSLEGPRLSDTQVLGSAPRADDTRLRDTLAGFAMAALTDRGLFSASDDNRSEFLKAAGERLLNAERGLADLQGQIGLDEARLDLAATEGAAERIALETAREALIGIDPFETAGQLQAAEVQIRSLYTVTARLSQLTLTAYLR